MERKLLMISKIFSLEPLNALSGLSVVFLLKKEVLIKKLIDQYQILNLN